MALVEAVTLVTVGAKDYTEGQRSAHGRTRLGLFSRAVEGMRDDSCASLKSYWTMEGGI